MVLAAARRHLVYWIRSHLRCSAAQARSAEELETPLGRKILAGEIKNGEMVFVGYDEASGELVFTSTPQAEGGKGMQRSTVKPGPGPTAPIDPRVQLSGGGGNGEKTGPRALPGGVG